MSGYSQQLVKAVRDADSRLLGVRLGRYCITKDIPIRDVAAYFKVPRQTVYNWFLGVHAPNKKYAQLINEYFEKVVNR